MGGQEAVDQPAYVRRREALLLKHGITAILQRRNDVRIGGRPADAVFLESLDEARFGIARRRLGKMLFPENPVYRNRFLFLQHRQLGFCFLLDVIGIFQIHRHEAGENQHLAGGAKQCIGMPDRHVNAGGVVPGRRHLARERTLPDHFVECRLIRGQELANRVGSVENGSWADRLVRFLCVLGFAAILDRRIRQIVGIELFLNIAADFLECFIGKRERVGAHVGNEADCVTAYIDALVELLRRAHGASRGHPQFAYGFLL